jgi:hypothetical protein
MSWNRCVTLAGGIAALFATCLAAAAQSFPVPPASIPGVAPPSPGGQQPACQRLEAQLAAIDRGPNDPARASQIGRYEEAIRRQQAELDRVIVRSRGLGCERRGFFSLFSQQPAECGPLTRQIQQIRSSIDQLMMELQRVQGGTADREAQRRSVLIALAENDCGPQYRSAAVNRQRGFFESLFGPGSIVSPPGVGDSPSGLGGSPSGGTYRTLCVRTCDGYYWPVSFSTVPSRFAEDDRVCQRMCPAAQVMLFAHRNPGEEVAQAVSLNGQSYSDLPNAFLYRKQFTASCSCRRSGETWAHALQHLDDTGERGDIVVTEERAKQLSKPREEQRSSRTPARGRQEAAPETPQGPQQTSRPPLRGNTDDRDIRNVGPTFLPAQGQRGETSQ